MHFRSLFLSILIWSLLIPASFAQKRFLTKVNPNADKVNADADLFVPSTGSFVPATGAMVTAREDQTAVALGDGRVLIAGGYNNRYLKSAELFDPSTGLFSLNYQTVTSPVTGSEITTRGDMLRARSGAGGVLLLDGTALIAGGYNGDYLSYAEIYHPDTGVFDNISASMSAARYHPTVTLLKNGRVLITGGMNTTFLSSVEIYNPFTKFFNATTNMSTPRVYHTATLLNSGKVLIVGGCTNTESNKIVCDKYLDSAEIYDPDEGTFEDAGNLNFARAEHTASLLPDGRVLIAGGTNGNGQLASAEIYDPETNTFTSTGSLGTPRKGHTASALPDGRILIAGGYSDHYLASAEIFDPSVGGGTFTTISSSSMSSPRLQHTATVLQDGRILLAGGLNSDQLFFDVNERYSADNVSPNIVYTSDPQVGFVSYPGSGTIVAFSPTTGSVLDEIATGGEPVFSTLLPGEDRLAVVSAFDNRIFIIGINAISESDVELSLEATYTFTNALFGYGSLLTLSPDGSLGYISSTGTGEVIQFNVATGNELHRLGGLDSPAQTTVTSDGNTLLVVDTETAMVHFVNTSTMDTNFTIDFRASYEPAGFTIYNKPVLSPNGEYGIIASQDIDASTSNAVFYFDASTGEIVDQWLIGNNPAFTTLDPGGDNWVILCANGIYLIPVDDPTSAVATSLAGAPLGSANIVFSQDARYAFFAASSQDRVLQFDMQTASVVGSYQVGDLPNESEDQPAGIAITPDGKIISVLNAVSNEIDFLVDCTLLKIPEFINDREQFTGLTLINVSDQDANLTIEPVNDSGGNSFYMSSGSFDELSPVQMPTLGPGQQFSLDLSQIFDFDNSENNRGHLEISSDQPGVVGFAVTGNIRATFLDSRLSGLNGMATYRFPERLYDWIVPDVPAEESSPAQYVFVNPNFSTTGYAMVHYGEDGSQLEANDAGTIDAANLSVQAKDNIFTSTLVSKVLVAGGQAVNSMRTTEIYFPDDVYFGSTGIMRQPRHGHAAVLLRSAEVLLSGGRNGISVLNSAEIYDPIKGGFLPITGTMIYPRYRHTATLLNDGRVLVAGGQNSVSINATAELFDPDTETFSETATDMVSPRDAHTATLLPDGRVLLTGGIDGTGISYSAEIFDPLTSTFTATGTTAETNMHAARAFHKAVLLQNGTVLITGGYNGEYLDSAEIYDPVSNTFTPIPPMNVARCNHTATLLEDGTVMIAGGMNSSGALDSVEFYFPSSNRFILATRFLASPRSEHTATLLPSGAVLFVSGTDGEDVLMSSEIYDPSSQSFTTISSTQNAMRDHTATLLQGIIPGYMRGTSDEGLMFRERKGAIAARIALDGLDVDRYAGVTEIYAPRFTTTSPDRTELNLINANEDEDARVTITLRGYDGSLIGTPVTRQLSIGHQINENLIDLFGNDPGVIGREGWIEVSSTVDRVVGTVSFGKIGGNIQTVFALSAIPVGESIVPLAAENNAYQTEIALLNASGQSQTFRLELWNDDGTMALSTSPITLPAGQSINQTLSQYFGTTLSRLYGYVRIRSNQSGPLELHGYSILRGRDGSFACAMPPIPVPEPE